MQLVSLLMESAVQHQVHILFNFMWKMQDLIQIMCDNLFCHIKRNCGSINSQGSD